MLIVRRNVLGMILLTLAAGQAGCVTMGGVRTVEGEKSLRGAHVAGSSLWVESDNGSVTVKTGAAEGVSVDATVRALTKERLELVTLRSERQDDGMLRVWVEWPQGRRESAEGASITVLLPEVTGVTVHTSNGGIHVDDAHGDANLSTSNGAITCVNQGGAVRATSSNAGVRIMHPGAEVVVGTSNGRVEVTDASASVKARSSNGGIIVAMNPTSAGPVDLVTSNGSVRLTVGPRFAGELGISTSNGQIRIPESGVTVLSRTRGSAKLQFGAGTAPEATVSRISTSNAGVTVESE